jgi:hypothetical protein
LPSRSRSSRTSARAPTGSKRFTRDGCYQIESGGSTGGSTYAHDSQAGCQRAADVAAIFARLDAIA